MTPSVSEKLQAARDLILEPDRWTDRSLARDAKGEAVDPCDPAACKWCAMGAVFAVQPNPNSSRHEMRNLLDAASLALYGAAPVEQVNDGEGHEAVIQVYDLAILQSEGKA